MTPRSIGVCTSESITAAAVAGSRGRPSAPAKSFPRPAASTPMAHLVCASAVATSCSVPSPPAARTRSTPLAAAVRASSQACPDAIVSCSTTSTPCCSISAAAARAIATARPRPATGLAITTTAGAGITNVNPVVGMAARARCTHLCRVSPSPDPADIPPRLAAALADRYRLVRELGMGGMATVYLAEDLKHHRQVAVKVLRPELAASLGTERFLREIEIAAGTAPPAHPAAVRQRHCLTAG